MEKETQVKASDFFSGMKNSAAGIKQRNGITDDKIEDTTDDKTDDSIDDDKIDDKVDEIIDDKSKTDDDDSDENPFDKIIPAKVKGKSKEENLASLRQRLENTATDLKEFKEMFGETKPELVKPFFEMVSEAIDGPITPEAVNNVISEIKSSRQEILDLRKELEEREKVVNEIDVRFSKDFKSKYEAPYKTALEGLYTEFSTTSGGKVIGPEATAKFGEFITSKPDLTNAEVKENLVKFAKEYKQETGEDAVLPSITSLMTSLRHFNSSREAMESAYNNWGVEKTKAQKEREQSAILESENEKRANKKIRTNLATKAWNDFNTEELPYESPEDLQALFREEFSFGEALFEGKDVPSWDKLLQRGVEARLWQKNKEEFNELKKFKEEYDASERNHLPGSDKQSSKAGSKGINWLTGKPRT